MTQGVRVTGERPVDGVSPDVLVASHEAGYRAVAERLPAGTGIDIGCGVGFGTAALASPDRTVIGVDYNADAAAVCHGRAVSPPLLAACMDGARLGLRPGALDWVCSSHVIEHFDDPSLHVRDIARVLGPDGVAFVLAPNAPADLENPFHVSPFTATRLREVLSRSFADVEVHGIDGDEVVKADFEERRRSARKLLALDVFDLRFKVPRSWYIKAYESATRVFYKLQSGKHAGGTTGIDASRFFVTDEVDDTTLFLFAIARSPAPAPVTN
jgi:SAM-dependent methyltransferase